MSSKESNATYNKRKRGILKKLIELSTISKLDIYLYAVDRQTKRTFEFCSTIDFNLKAVETARQDKATIDFSKYFNSDYEFLIDSMTPKQFSKVETTHKRMLKELQSIKDKLDGLENANSLLETKNKLEDMNDSQPTDQFHQLAELDFLISISDNQMDRKFIKKTNPFN